MNEIILEIVRDPLGILLLGTAAVITASSVGAAVHRWLGHVIENRVDEREERQAKERAEQRHRHRLEKAEKLETVASILIADKSLAEGIRDKIDAEYPKVRVEEVEEETEEIEPEYTHREVRVDEPPRRRRSKRR